MQLISLVQPSYAAVWVPLQSGNLARSFPKVLSLSIVCSPVLTISLSDLSLTASIVVLLHFSEIWTAERDGCLLQLSSKEGSGLMDGGLRNALHYWQTFVRTHPMRVGTITGLDYWTGLLNWTTGLTQTAKYNSFSAEQKSNVLIPSVNLLTLLPTALASFNSRGQRSHAYLMSITKHSTMSFGHRLGRHTC